MDELSQLQKTVTTLQETLTFQQRTIDDLNEVIIAMRTDIDRISRQHEQQKSRIEWLSANAESDIDPNEKPPHY